MQVLTKLNVAQLEFLEENIITQRHTAKLSIPFAGYIIGGQNYMNQSWFYGSVVWQASVQTTFTLLHPWSISTLSVAPTINQEETANLKLKSYSTVEVWPTGEISSFYNSRISKTDNILESHFLGPTVKRYLLQLSYKIYANTCLFTYKYISI